MRIEFSPFGVHVSAIAPGSISTPMLNRSPDQLNRLADATAEKPSARLCGCPRVREDCRVRPKIFNLSGEGIADDPPAVTAPRPRTRYLVGTDAMLSAFLKRNLPDRWMDIRSSSGCLVCRGDGSHVNPTPG
jgi:hypothetical protein